MIIDLEAQLLRDGLPLTRPSRWSNGLDSFDVGRTATWKLFPGSVNMGEAVQIAVYNHGFIMPHWINVSALPSINGVAWPSPRPGQLFVDDLTMWPYGGWSCVTHYPIVSHIESFRGAHTLLLRTIIEPAAKR